jgi:hypothetical protein
VNVAATACYTVMAELTSRRNLGRSSSRLLVHKRSLLCSTGQSCQLLWPTQWAQLLLPALLVHLLLPLLLAHLWLPLRLVHLWQRAQAPLCLLGPKSNDQQQPSILQNAAGEVSNDRCIRIAAARRRTSEYTIIMHVRTRSPGMCVANLTEKKKSVWC